MDDSREIETFNGLAAFMYANFWAIRSAHGHHLREET
jgi:hypothetical protein